MTNRDRTVIFRVSRQEYADLQSRAGAAGQSLSVWLREQVLRGDRIAELERRIEALEAQSWPIKLRAVR